MAATVTAQPGQTAKVRFVLTWSTPNCVNFWNPGDESCVPGAGCECVSDVPNKPWKNYYATLWKEIKESLIYALSNYNPAFNKETLAFPEDTSPCFITSLQKALEA